MENNHTRINIEISKKWLLNFILTLGFLILIACVIVLENLRYKHPSIAIIIADFIFFSYSQYLSLRWMKNMPALNKIKYLVPLFISIALTLYSLILNFSALDPVFLKLERKGIFLWGSYHFLIGFVFTVVFMFIRRFIKNRGKLK